MALIAAHLNAEVILVVTVQLGVKQCKERSCRYFLMQALVLVETDRNAVGLDWIDDRLYSAILRSLEQTHCARM